MKAIALAFAVMLAFSSIASAEGTPPVPPSGNESMPAINKTLEKYVPGLEARSKYTGCRIDYQIAVIDWFAAFTNRSGELDASAETLLQLKGGMEEAALAGNVSAYNNFVKGSLAPAMAQSANLTRLARREMFSAGFENYSAAALEYAGVHDAIYGTAKMKRLSCEEQAREHVKEMKRLTIQERVQAAKANLTEAKAARQGMQAESEILKEVRGQIRESLRLRLDEANKSQGKYIENEDYGESKGNGSGNGEGEGKSGSQGKN